MLPSKPRLMALAALILLIGPGQAAGQNRQGNTSDDLQFFPQQGFMLTGYGAAGYRTLFGEDAHPNDFSALFAPILLFQVSDRFLFEGELEFAIEEGLTETDLEYAQIDAALNNNVTVVAGKFLLPFNAFSERYHPTWINHLVTPPPLYGGHGSVGPADPMLPILSDFGVQLRGAFDVGRFNTVTVEAFVSQGPAPAQEEHGDMEEAVTGQAATRASGAVRPAQEEDEHTDVGFGDNFPDNNEDKMFGGRFGFVVAPHFEVNLSGMTGAYDPQGDLRFSALGAHLEGRYRRFTLHSEFIRTWQDVDEDAAATGVLSRNGYWAALDYRLGSWQPVIRFTQLFEGKLEGDTITEAGRQLSMGLDYWFGPAFALKVEYVINDEEEDIQNNLLALQLAFGF